MGQLDLSDLAEMDICPDELDRVLAQPGDVIACEGGDPGRAAVWTGPGTIALQKALHRIQPTEAILPAYLALLLQHLAMSRQLESFFTGTTIKHLPQEKLRLVGVPLPSRAEQERIVEAIEEHLSRLDVAKALLSAAEERVDLLARVSTRRLFASQSWPWTTLGEVAEIKGGVTKDSKRQADPSFVEVPYLRVANMQRGRLDLREVATIQVHPNTAKALCLETGDVLMNEGGDHDKLGQRLGLGGSDRGLHPPEPRLSREGVQRIRSLFRVHTRQYVGSGVVRKARASDDQPGLDQPRDAQAASRAGATSV